MMTVEFLLYKSVLMTFQVQRAMVGIQTLASGC